MRRIFRRQRAVASALRVPDWYALDRRRGRSATRWRKRARRDGERFVPARNGPNKGAAVSSTPIPPIYIYIYTYILCILATLTATEYVPHATPRHATPMVRPWIYILCRAVVHIGYGSRRVTAAQPRTCVRPSAASRGRRLHMHWDMGGCGKDSCG